ncbi:sensor histidine kinase [Pseudolysinimonas sp.]|uniref:sensor histidine kinase n=1 Tax=Pseudolysinimonas sp. TaxID=2680009 RepID=UPI003F7FDE20
MLPMLVDVVFMAAAAVELALGDLSDPVLAMVLGIAAIAAVPLRHRVPWVALVFTLPAVTDPGVLTPALLALFTVAQGTVRRRWVLALPSAAVIVLWLAPWDYTLRLPLVYGAIYSIMFGITPVALGQLVQARRSLASRLDELIRLRESERNAVVEQTRAEERARLAREMHDVVSHQVSLIAVQAGALQVSAPDATTRNAAVTLRDLARRTLDELRQMLDVLRVAAPAAGQIAPQPDLSQLPQLVHDSGVDARLTTDLPVDLPVPVQRALFRVVQEGLTNIRKHAPGASAEIAMSTAEGILTLRLRNGPPTQSAGRIPGSGHGFIGIRERAELLGGTFHGAATSDGGFELTVLLPLRDRVG